MKILLIAGHGAGDPGAVGNGHKEADLARAFATALSDQIGKYANVDVFDTNKNMYQYLSRGGQFDFSPYDYVLEIHFNAGGGKGTEILVHKNQSGIEVEKQIVNSVASVGLSNRGVKRRYDLSNMNKLFRLKKKYALLEICFIDNASDVKVYLNNVEKIAKAVADSIRAGFKIPEPAKELTEINDIVWELGERNIIGNKGLWLVRLSGNTEEYWLARKGINYIGRATKKPTVSATPLSTANDIVWELAERGIISDKGLWLDKLQKDINAYWLANKLINYIRKEGLYD